MARALSARESVWTWTWSLRLPAPRHPERKAGSRARLGADILVRSGYPAAAEIVRQHHDLDRIPKRADETLVVYLADKMVQGDQEVTLEERFAGSLGKCVRKP